MISNLRTTSAVAAVLLLAACAANTAGVKPGSAASNATVQDPACVSQTSSRPAGTAKNCAAFGRSYSSDDITRTGATTTGDALRLLDPAITVHR
jgi:hypothetical protein